jgi:hypothetical protein
MAYSKATPLILGKKVIDSLTWHRNHDKRTYVQERAAAILKIGEGRSPHWVARNGLVLRRDPDTVYNWLEIFKAEGMKGLEAHQHGGLSRRRLMDPAGRIAGSVASSA